MNDYVALTMIRHSLGLLRRVPLFAFFAGISLAIGFLVPTIFELGQTPAARHRDTAMEWAAIATLVLTIIACILFVWLGKREGDHGERQKKTYHPSPYPLPCDPAARGRR